MSQLILVSLVLLYTHSSYAGGASIKKAFGAWHTTHGVEKFPCMDEKENQYFQRLITVHRSEERQKILADHRQQVKPSSRQPASVSPKALTSNNYVCPPFRGVRNPHPQVVEFGKAATVEHFKIAASSMTILDGTKKNEKWNLNYIPRKGYFEGATKKGTPINLIPLPSNEKNPRFLVQYILWQDKTPPSLTLCYREDLHKQCNPYPDPAEANPPQERQPASTSPQSPQKAS